MKGQPMLTIDRSSPEPVYEQIARQVRGRIAGGDLSAGVPLPAVRILASDLGVNLNTVARAYRLLEGEGFVTIRGRSGVFVAAPAARPDPDGGERLRRELGALLARMRQAGMTAAELERVAEREIAALADGQEKAGGEP